MLRVNGGPAHSGTVVKRERGGPWVCMCNDSGPETSLANPVTFKVNAPYWVSCPDCGTKRP